MVKKNKNVKLNKFEKTRLLSSRAYELSKGGASNVKVTKKGALLGNDYVLIAEKELNSDKSDLEIYYSK